MTVTTRVGYAIARDNGFPCSYHLSKINKYTKNPDAMLILVFILSSALCFLPLYSERAFTAITGITTVSYQISYAIPIWFRITSSRDSFVPSHFNLGKYSLLVGWISAIWLTLTSVIMFLPTSYDPILGYTVDNFNYTIVVISITGAFAFVYWILPEPYGARHFFQ
jgi:amino acid transporter